MNGKEFWEFLDTVKEKYYFELIKQNVFEKPLFPPLYSYIRGQIMGRLFMFADANKMGFTFGRLYYELSDDLVLVPDNSFVLKSRITIPFPERMTSAPDIAVEVLFPDYKWDYMLFKTESYLRYGTKMVWIVYPEDEMVDVWRTMTDGSLNKRTFKKEDTLSGEDVLPDFILPVSDIFNL